MPLSSKGASIKGDFTKRYGAEQGERVFYATANKKPAFDKAVHGGRARMHEKRRASGRRSVSGRR
jgi:hypothetical protein